ncbi:unnamed protein product [Peniophora sp. CBMAI 1063]|nr:unnamed protein product [Peniophora sp. CBMAI 1063]
MAVPRGILTELTHVLNIRAREQRSYITHDSQVRIFSTNIALAHVTSTQKRYQLEHKMGRASKALDEFIESIPDSKLKPTSTNAGTLYKDKDFRLDMQGMTSDKPQKYNLQVQINKETKITSLKNLQGSGTTVAEYQANAGDSAAIIRSKLLADNKLKNRKD